MTLLLHFMGHTKPCNFDHCICNTLQYHPCIFYSTWSLSLCLGLCNSHRNSLSWTASTFKLINRRQISPNTEFLSVTKDCWWLFFHFGGTKSISSPKSAAPPDDGRFGSVEDISASYNAAFQQSTEYLTVSGEIKTGTFFFHLSKHVQFPFHDRWSNKYWGKKFICIQLILINKM